MGKGYLTPDTRTLEACEIPVFKTHPTPVNVSVKTGGGAVETSKKKNNKDVVSHNSGSSIAAGRSSTEVSQGCGCVIL